MSHVDGFVAAAPTANKGAYRQYATAATEVFKELSALSVVECWGDDVPDGETTSFPMTVKCREDELFAFRGSSGRPAKLTTKRCRRSSPMPGCKRTRTRCHSMASA